MRAVEWNAPSAALVLIDQTKLPSELDYLECRDVDTLVDAIERLVVRGAPALGAVGGYGVAVAMLQGQREDWSADRLASEVLRVRDARPTAVNLAWGADRVLPFMQQGVAAVLAESDAIMVEDEAANRELSRLGADWILANVTHRPVRVLTHCNTGFLATTAWGTALGIVRELHERGEVEVVYADETRPLLQGSRLTAWELDREGIPYFVQADGAAASTIMRGLVDVAIIGADRIARNGDTANKIGSVGVALACADADIPFVVAAPSSTVDLDTVSGESIHIELRAGEEVTSLGGVRTAPDGARGFNPAFDVTPHRLISAIVSEQAVVEPDGSDVSALVAQ
ncbi:MAG: S-methyl-5-thioribose-1-phosphate isomerase [Candidatus Nanopelagicales bacterium]|nr:S-methyl-5-thioribose-1-phosphate isomerase [Candidatus Nanopelagicales bacterium]